MDERVIPEQWDNLERITVKAVEQADPIQEAQRNANRHAYNVGVLTLRRQRGEIADPAAQHCIDWNEDRAKQYQREAEKLKKRAQQKPQSPETVPPSHNRI